jgi:hypothetical protein
MAPCPPLPLSSQQVVSLSQSSCLSPVELNDWRGGEGVGEEPNREKAWSSGNHLILSGYDRYAHSVTLFCPNSSVSSATQVEFTSVSKMQRRALLKF